MTLLCCQQTDESGLDISDSLSVLALVLAVAVIYVGKRVDVAVDRFEKLCVNPLEEQYKVLDELFINNRFDHVSKHLVFITETTGDIVRTFIALKKVYPKLDINELQDITLAFSDDAYSKSARRIHHIQNSYLEMKVILLDKIYRYALYQEVRLFSRLFWFKK